MFFTVQHYKKGMDFISNLPPYPISIGYYNLAQSTGGLLHQQSNYTNLAFKYRISSCSFCFTLRGLELQ